MSEKKNELEDLIRMAHVVAKPYLIAVWVLSLLLLVSVGANVYLATIEKEVVIEHNSDFNNSDNNDNHITKG